MRTLHIRGCFPRLFHAEIAQPADDGDRLAAFAPTSH